MSTPAQPVPLGQPTHADRVRAADRLSITLHRDIRPGSWPAEVLAGEYAQSFRDGYEQAMRDLAAGTTRQVTA